MELERLTIWVIWIVGLPVARWCNGEISDYDYDGVRILKLLQIWDGMAGSLFDDLLLVMCFYFIFCTLRRLWVLQALASFRVPAVCYCMDRIGLDGLALHRRTAVWHKQNA